MDHFRFQRTWFYPADLGRSCSGYQTRSAIKGILRHNSKGDFQRGEKWGFRGIVQRFKRYILRALIAQQGKERKKQNIREPR